VLPPQLEEARRHESINEDTLGSSVE
jgi:hypothetical protein